MDRQWMYADRRSKEFIDGVHYFLRVAEANRQRGFICCPCNKCKNQKEYSASRTIHFHLFESGFMPSYNCWTSHGEQGVEMEEDEVEDDNIPDFAQYAGFEGNQTGEEERDADGNDVADDLGQMLQDAKEDCESEKEWPKLTGKGVLFVVHAISVRIRRSILHPGLFISTCLSRGSCQAIIVGHPTESKVLKWKKMKWKTTIFRTLLSMLDLKEIKRARRK